LLLRKDTELPTFTKSNMDIDDPHRAKERREIEDPM